MSKILYGADPEAAALYEKNGKLYALPPFFFREFLGVPASDDRRHPVFLMGDGWKLHEDGANFEMSVKPSHDPLELFQTIQACAKATEESILSAFPEFCDGKLHFRPTVLFELERWNAMREEHGENFWKRFSMSTEFGCDPDEDVFDTAKCSVQDASKHPFRYCGGHIHFSGSPKIEEDPHMAVRCAVITAGLAAVAFSDVPQLERDRTFLYGRPGKFRIQNYGADNPYGPDYQIGFEYRTPSARWAGDWDIAREVLRWAEIGITNLLETSLGTQLTAEITEPAKRAILEADQPLARELLSYVESKL